MGKRHKTRFVGKKYKIKFDLFGLIAFLLVMIPNIVWFFVPAHNDVLRKIKTSTEILDLVAKICQVFIAFCFTFIVIRSGYKKRLPIFIISFFIFLILYYLCWIIYYIGANAFTVMGLTILPCFAFVCLSFYKNNMIALVPVLIFTVCHFVYALSNFAF